MKSEDNTGRVRDFTGVVRLGVFAAITFPLVAISDMVFFQTCGLKSLKVYSIGAGLVMLCLLGAFVEAWQGKSSSRGQGRIDFLQLLLTAGMALAGILGSIFGGAYLDFPGWTFVAGLAITFSAPWCARQIIKLHYHDAGANSPDPIEE